MRNLVTIGDLFRFLRKFFSDWMNFYHLLTCARNASAKEFTVSSDCFAIHSTTCPTVHCCWSLESIFECFLASKSIKYVPDSFLPVKFEKFSFIELKKKLIWKWLFLNYKEPLNRVAASTFRMVIIHKTTIFRSIEFFAWTFLCTAMHDSDFLQLEAIERVYPRSNQLQHKTLFIYCN